MIDGDSSMPHRASGVVLPVLFAALAAAGLSLALASLGGAGFDRPHVEPPAYASPPAATPHHRAPNRLTTGASLPAAKPRARLIATGGTISNRGDRRLTADELLASVPGLASYVRAEGEQFRNVQSAELSLDDFCAWRAVSARFSARIRISLASS
jgi:hypothetical protein